VAGRPGELADLRTRRHQLPARRAFNKVFVPYDAAKQNFAPLEARQIELPREDSVKGTWSYVPIDIPNQTGRTLGVYLPPDYDPNRAEPYKTIYMQHGGGQDQSDWMNMGNVPVIMDNLLQDGTTEPAVVITANTNYLGPVGNQAVQGDAYPNLRNVVIPFVEANYNVSTDAIDRAFAGLSAGSIVANNLIRDDATLFGYWGPWSGGISVPASTPNIAAPYIQYGGGAWDFGLPNPQHRGRARPGRVRREHRGGGCTRLQRVEPAVSRSSLATTCGSRRRSSPMRSPR
jgi:hypothetical protein